MTLGCLLGVLSSQEIIRITYEFDKEHRSIKGTCEDINILINPRFKFMRVTRVENIDGVIAIWIKYNDEVSECN